MSRAVLLCAGLTILAGCGDSSARAYYHTRYVPTSSEVAFSAPERARWKGDLSVYELPSAAPDLEGEAQQRNLCAKPGPQFKPQTAVGIHDEVRASGHQDIQVAGGTDKRPVPLGALSPLPGYPVAVIRGPDVAGVSQDNFHTKAGGWDIRPRNHGSNVIAVDPMAAMRPLEKIDYCLPPETPNTVTTEPKR